MYVESVLLQKLILRSTGASLANRVGLIMTGAWLSPCTRGQLGTRDRLSSPGLKPFTSSYEISIRGYRSEDVHHIL